MWAVKCKKRYDGCNWRLCICCCKICGLFEITKYIGPHTCVYPKLLQDNSQLDSTLITCEIQNVIQSDHTTSIVALHQIMKDKFDYNVYYKRIWEAKRKTIIKIYGDWDESYQAYLVGCVTTRAAVLDPTTRPNPIRDAVLFSNPIPFSFVSKTYFQCSFCKRYLSL